jgi:hypothetical protein
MKLGFNFVVLDYCNRINLVIGSLISSLWSYFHRLGVLLELWSYFRNFGVTFELWNYGVIFIGVTFGNFFHHWKSILEFTSYFNHLVFNVEIFELILKYRSYLNH